MTVFCTTCTRAGIPLSVVFFILFCTAGVAAEDDDGFSLRVAPQVTLPVGDDSDLYEPGGSGTITGGFSMPFYTPLRVTADVGYAYIPLAEEIGSMSLVSVGAGVGLNFAVAPWLNVYTYGKGGYFFAALNDAAGTRGGNPWMYAGGGAAFRPWSKISIALEGGYRHYCGLYSDVAITIGTVFHLGRPDDSRSIRKESGLLQEAPPVEEKAGLSDSPEAFTGELEISELRFEPVFPVLYSFYDDNPIGRAVIKNGSNVAVEHIELSFFAKQYMDNPKTIAVADSLEPGLEVQTDIYALFNGDILDVTEGEKVSARISIAFTAGGEEHEQELYESVTINNRNALTWDDDRKVCAFITAKDPAVMRFAKNISAGIQGKGSRATDKHLRSAMAIHEALDLFGISYVIDPSTPYQELSESEDVIDYLQFPRQTLEFMAGDCDDLSALYAALLESLGIETALITVPGHIFMAFALDTGPGEARRRFSRPDNLIFEGGKAWLPLEITLRGEGFYRAWQLGAKQWREYNGAGTAVMYPVHAGWRIYKPVGYPGAVSIDMPDTEAVVEAFISEEKGFIKREIAEDVAKLRGKIAETRENPRWINKLGILYARYGFDDEALEEFEKVRTLKPDFYPAIINMGNIHYLRDEIEEALGFYREAAEFAPENGAVLLGLSRTNHKLENYYGARQYYDKLKTVSPGLAERFAYLDLRGDEAARAAAAGNLDSMVLWEED